tara:strand:+ start:1117 stop:2229 length:1113 start_codon:yes stop_codon:yes gene_type:complete
MATISEVADVIMGQAPAGDAYNDNREGLPLIAGASDFGQLTPEPSRYTTVSPKRSYKDDIILCVRATIGDLNWSDREYCLGRGVAGIRAHDDKVDRRYLWRALEANTSGLRHLGRGATFLQITRKDIAEYSIPLPPLPEQRRIAAILDQADALRSLRRQSLSRLSDLGQAIFFKMFGDPATNPFGFKRASLGEIIKFQGGSQPAKSTFLYEDGADRVRLVQIRDFRTDNYKTYVPAHLAKRPFTEKDVMIGRYGPPVFQIFRGLSGTYNVALMKAAPVKGIGEDFVFYLLQEPKLHRHIVANSERTAGQSGVNLELLEKYPAYFPPEDRQSDFIDRISVVDDMSAKLELAMRNAESLFASLQHRAFRGEL